MKIDRVDVSRAAHQLELDHGLRACRHAEKLAKDAEWARLEDDAAFWHSGMRSRRRCGRVVWRASSPYEVGRAVPAARFRETIAAAGMARPTERVQLCLWVRNHYQ